MARFEIWIFQRKSDPTSFAVTPNAGGRILPDPSDWEPAGKGAIDPEQARAMGSTEIEGWIQAFQKDGYCLLSHQPKGGVYFTEIENVSPADVEALKNRK